MNESKISGYEPHTNTDSTSSKSGYEPLTNSVV